MPTKKRKFGDLGENIAEQYLIKKGYLILERNFRVRLGELDIIALKTENREKIKCIGKLLGNRERGNNEEIMGNREIRKKILSKNANLVFVEVKSGKLKKKRNDYLRPEEHLDFRKKWLLIRSAQIYLAYKKLPLDINWQIDVIAVEIDKDDQKANLRHIERAVTL